MASHVPTARINIVAISHRMTSARQNRDFLTDKTKGRVLDMTMTNQELWQRYQDYLWTNENLGMTLDISRMNFTPEFLATMEPRDRKSVVRERVCSTV